MTEQLCRETEAACSSPFCSCLKSTVTVWRHRFSLLLQLGPGSGLSLPGSQGAWNLLSPAVPAGRAGRGALLLRQVRAPLPVPGHHDTSSVGCFVPAEPRTTATFAGFC